MSDNEYHDIEIQNNKIIKYNAQNYRATYLPNACFSIPQQCFGKKNTTFWWANQTINYVYSTALIHHRSRKLLHSLMSMKYNEFQRSKIQSITVEIVVKEQSTRFPKWAFNHHFRVFSLLFFIYQILVRFWLLFIYISIH